MKPTEKQIQYLAYKLQEYGMVETKYYNYSERTSDEAVKECSDIWEKTFDVRIEDMSLSEVKSILDVFAPDPFGRCKRYRERLSNKLSKFNKENENGTI